MDFLNYLFPFIFIPQSDFSFITLMCRVCIFLLLAVYNIRGDVYNYLTVLPCRDHIELDRYFTLDQFELIDR